MIIDCISDLHGFYPELEGGDLLIVAGDLCANAKSSHQQLYALSWIQNQKYQQKIFIAGNHDTWLEKVPEDNFSLWKITYLFDSGIKFKGFKIWGSPWTKKFEGMNPECMAFTKDTDEELAEKWDLIPDDIDILVTHSPPYDMLDEVKMGLKIEHVGSKSLFKRCCEIKPRYHIFGHIHENGGKRLLMKWDHRNTNMINASYVNREYAPVNKPIRVIL